MQKAYAHRIHSSRRVCRLGGNERAEGVYTQYMTDGEQVSNNADKPYAKSVMIAGAGKIGSAIVRLLLQETDYRVYLADRALSPVLSQLAATYPQLTCVTLDCTDAAQLKTYIRQESIEAVLSSLPFYLNEQLALVARETDCHYFDLTEDVAVTAAVKRIAEGAQKAFVPQCGVAPGMVNIIANSLIQTFSTCKTVYLRVGALPQRAGNALHYFLNWSTDGVINEYANRCHGLENGQPVTVAPLEGLETLELNGVVYEAFNTSGGLGSLPALYENKVETMNYKTIRYPGHCEKMRFLMHDLELRQDRQTLKQILEKVIPKTVQDLVIIYVSVAGIKAGVFTENSYFKKIVPTCLAGLDCSAIQLSTAAGICAVMDLVMHQKNKYKGLILQENIAFSKILSNRFGHYFNEGEQDA